MFFFAAIVAVPLGGWWAKREHRQPGSEFGDKAIASFKVGAVKMVCAKPRKGLKKSLTGNADSVPGNPPGCRNPVSFKVVAGPQLPSEELWTTPQSTHTCFSHGSGSKPMVPFSGRCTAHFRTYFSGDWDVHWGYDLDFYPQPHHATSLMQSSSL